MKLAQTALATSLLLFLLTWLWFKGSTTEAFSAEAELDALNDFSMAQSALHRDLLGARVGLLRNYDPLTKQTAALHDALMRLHVATAGDPPLAAAVARLETLVQLQERWTEQFKSQNALLQNSLAYFSLFSGRLEDTQGDATRRATALATAMLRLTLDTSASVAADVDAHIQEMSRSRLSADDVATTRALLAHAKLLHDLLPETDAALKSVLSLTSDTHVEDIRLQVVQRQQQAEGNAKRFRYLLFATSLALAGALVYLGLSLQARSRALRKRAAMDHVLAGMSTRFINSRPEQIAPIVEQGLAEIAACWQADRTYFVSVRPQAEAHTYVWCRPGVSLPAEWPERASAFAASYKSAAGEVLLLEDLRRSSHSPGLDAGQLPVDLRDWLGIPSKGAQVNALLGLDFVRSTSGSGSRGGEVGQLRMAFDAIANAVERDFLERERARLEANLQRARRMETVGALASGVAHNFNNIIGAILGFAESARSRLPPDARAAEDLGEIQRAGERATDLVDQLMTFGRRGSTLRTPTPLDALVRESKTLLEASLPATVTIVFREPSTPVTVLAAPAQLQQVILNISNNAAQAMDLAGVIDIVIAERELEQADRLDIGELPPGRYGVLSISDSGRGMDAAVRERIFEPFFTTRAAGNGLGLATVREIVLEHGGGLQVHSNPGMGTRFDIWLPAGELVPPSQPTVADQTAGYVQGNGETILVFEANRGRLLMHEEILAALGYEPVGFTDPDAVIAACAQAPERFDVALLCCQARGNTREIEDEVRMSARLREAVSRLPVILATSSARDLQAPSLVGNNIVAIIGQPPTMTELAANLARCLRPALRR